ncbi:branched-chain amino acid aminotransferase [Candidatus Blochmanniella vafra str. BVAF]|uniref:Branched-chain-amino-acid aminotransferase n=1 Tax=Blochmanniella vafra (strain BVAF) TaxID=859654 RepID=E8Q6J8_BLOVB|nr:branched-chain amino acid transaminase [Candidatus Blochmannia vafer]ADV33967.1 branched-chain amino acid aminotransferase [Candidatus Blochmannia vafer str. BVAF]
MIKKSNFIWFNGKMVPWDKANIHVLSHALHYGSSVFEGMRCYQSYKGAVIFRLKDHIQRLINSAKIYRMPISWSRQELIEACKIVIRKNNLIDAYIRPLLFIGDVGIEINPIIQYDTDLVIIAFYWESYLGKDSLNLGIDAMVSSWNRVSANTIPYMAKAGGNYLSSMLISNEAHRHGYHEGIGLNIFGYISEGSGENLFVIKDGIILTPSCSSSVLLGITRDSIIKLAASINLEVRECMLPREYLYIADEVFMVGTAAEITPVRSIDGIKIGSGGVKGPITMKLQELFFGLFTGEVKDEWDWLEEV